MDIHATNVYDLSIKVVIYLDAIQIYNSLRKRSKLINNLSSHVAIQKPQTQI